MASVMRLILLGALITGGAVLAGCQDSLHDEVARGDRRAVEVLLNAAPELIDSRNDMGKTPLHHAVSFRRIAMMGVLSTRGADLAARDDTGMTPLHSAALLGFVDEAAWLLSHGAPVEARDVFGDTPVHTAVVFGRSGVLRVLSEHGANLRATNAAGMTPLELARKYGHERTARNVLRLIMWQRRARVSGE